MADDAGGQRRGGTRAIAVVAGLIGLGLAVTLLATNDAGRIWNALEAAGWGAVLVVALHLPQSFLSGVAFRTLIPRADRWARGLGTMWLMRWIRESVNTLLPVAQVGGDVVRVRLLAQPSSGRGLALKDGIAASLVDVTVEMGAQLVFTLAGVAILLAGAHAGGAGSIAATAVAATAAIALAFLGAQRFGLVRLVQRLVARLTRGGGWSGLGDASGLEEAVLALYRDPRRMLASGGWHLASWAAGIAETWVAIRVLGLAVPGDGWRAAAIIESLGQAVRAIGFLVPGALGVQEGGYLVICAMFGIAAPQALALSLLRRVRELALGLPGLATWQWLEWRYRRAS